MTTMTLAPTIVFRGFTAAGGPLVGGLLNTYQAGSSTPLATYIDSTGLTPNTNPVVLNARGEANVWIPPNIAYKWVLTDSAGNLIWSQDHIVNSQLLSLYGGTDTGVVNAYVLTFVSPFTALTDGMIVYFLPANTNTGPSTLDINGFGVVNILNQNGSAMLAGQIIANQQAAVIYRAGNFTLLPTATIPWVIPTGGSQITIQPADIQARGVALCKFKAATTPRPSVTILANDPDLVIPITVLGTYQFDCVAYCDQAVAGTVGITCNVNYSGGLTLTSSHALADAFSNPGGYQTPTDTGVAPAVTTTLLTVAAFATIPTQFVRFSGTFVATSAGSFAFAWAQSTASANATNVLAGSTLKVTQLS